MNDEISLKQEELRYMRNDSIELEKEMNHLKDEVKKTNKLISDCRVIITFK